MQQLHSYANGISPQEYQQIQQWFNAVDTNRSGQLDVNELHRCLCMGGHQFSVAVTQKILNAFDTDRSGEIGLFTPLFLFQKKKKRKKNFGHLGFLLTSSLLLSPSSRSLELVLIVW